MYAVRSYWKWHCVKRIEPMKLYWWKLGQNLALPITYIIHALLVLFCFALFWPSVGSVLFDADFILDPGFRPLLVSPVAVYYCSHCFSHLFFYHNSFSLKSPVKKSDYLRLFAFLIWNACILTLIVLNINTQQKH